MGLNLRVCKVEKSLNFDLSYDELYKIGGERLENADCYKNNKVFTFGRKIDEGNYKVEDLNNSVHFSYSEYLRFRVILATLVEQKPFDVCCDKYFSDTHKKEINNVFDEYMTLSDCEGYFDYDFAKRLLEYFRKNVKKVYLEASNYKNVYNRFLDLLEVASKEYNIIILD